MNKLTDILTTFFVSSKPLVEKQPSVKKNIDIKKNKDNDKNVSKPIDIKQHKGDEHSKRYQEEREKYKRFLSSDVGIKTTITSSESSVLFDKESEKKKSKSASTHSSSSTKESERSQDIDTETTKSDKDIDTKTTKESERSQDIDTETTKKSSKDIDTETAKEKSNNVNTRVQDKQSIESKRDNIETELQNASDKSAKLKKYILKPSEFYKKNIMIVNDDIKDSIGILGDIMYKLSLMKDVSNLYDSYIHIVSLPENKKFYRQMLLDNPYLYFINFDVKHTFSKKKINEIDNDAIRTIYIIDNHFINDNEDTLKTLVGKNVQVFIIANNDNTVDDSYHLLDNNKLLINKQNKLKSIQKQFYKNIVKNICHISSFDAYYTLTNNENHDIKYIIIKDDELRYN